MEAAWGNKMVSPVAGSMERARYDGLGTLARSARRCAVRSFGNGFPTAHDISSELPIAGGNESGSAMFVPP